MKRSMPLMPDPMIASLLHIILIVSLIGQLSAPSLARAQSQVSSAPSPKQILLLIVAIGFCLAQSLLIAGLWLQRRRKKAAEESPRKAEEKYRNIFEGAIEGIFETSPLGQPLTANPALARILGYACPEEFRSSIRGRANQVWVDPEERAEYVRLLGDLVRTHEFERVISLFAEALKEKANG